MARVLVALALGAWMLTSRLISVTVGSRPPGSALAPSEGLAPSESLAPQD